jgi:hypothetical protein
MKISGNYEDSHWKTLTFATEADWEKGIAIFQDRMETRYLRHVRRILEKTTSGFAALTLDCAVIEALEQFRRGKKKTPRREGKKYFVSFFTKTSFSDHVTEEKARLFYTAIRCGLVHQTEAQDSLVRRNSKAPLMAFTKDRKGLIVNAKVFHEQLEAVILEYADKLRKPESKDQRAAFRKKVNFICRVDEKNTAAPAVSIVS